ncbi:hypothetical protein ACQKLP_20295 [Chitinophaga sp. NPDC101104]|uniref:hypothetical protein n=1 Tax=Chitinophaga sp. NPDC101104 TaxID=3390561 RepID=UPI003D000F11
MQNDTPRIENDVQDRNSIAWKKLCEYVDKVAEENLDEFTPSKELGAELFAQIHTLPESISKLTKVRKISLYGSSLKRIPPEIGQMESLEFFDPYTSYGLNWLPYEITKCKNLNHSRISTRALFGNFKYRTAFPDLTENPVRYTGDRVQCSVCGMAMSYEQTNQLWITLYVGNDAMPLLANLCSKTCEATLPLPPEDYVQFPHKGGSGLVQPLTEDELFELEMENDEIDQSDEEIAIEPLHNDKPIQEKQSEKKAVQLIRLIKKIWDR